MTSSQIIQAPQMQPRRPFPTTRDALGTRPRFADQPDLAPVNPDARTITPDGIKAPIPAPHPTIRRAT